MNMALMRFGEISLPHNPKTLKIEHTQSISNISLLEGTQRVNGVTKELIKVKGTGELYGKKCFEQYNKLQTLFLNQKEEVLSIPEIGSVKAVLYKLELSADPKDDLLTVSFEFRQVNNSELSEKITQPEYCTARKGECLWDIAYIYKTDIERLAGLNPWIRNIWNIEEGKEVKLR